jgi:lambda family phage tail tape measure protein
VRTAGTAGVETSDLAAAQAQEAGILAAAPAERAATLTNFILNQTSALREQNATQQRNNELQAYRNTLTGQFADSGFVDLQVSLKEQQLLQNEALAKYTILVTENPELSGVLGEVMQTQNELYAERIRLLTETYNAQQLLNGSMSAGFTAGAGQYLQSLGTLNQATAQLAQTGFKGVEDAIFDLVTTGTTNFAAFAASILRDTARMIIQQLVMKSIMQAIGFIGGPAAAVGNPTAPGGDVMGAIGRLLGNANGNAFATNNIVPYAMGGLVTKPTLFRYANGGVPSTGLMGEAGPEAIMPLRRLPNGRLGVESSTSGSPITVNVNVDAKGSSVEGDEGQSKALAGVISAAVQSELVKQKRPGGLLAGTR